MLGFREGCFYNFLSYLDCDEEWRGWIACQERFPTNHLVISSASEGLIDDLDNEDDDDDNDDDYGTSSSVKAESPGHQQHAYHHHVTFSPRFPPRFISCPNGTLFLAISHKKCSEDAKYVTHGPRKHSALAGPILLQTPSSDVYSIHTRRTRTSSTTGTEGT